MGRAFAHIEGQYDWSRIIPFVQILTGFNYRNFIVSPDGNNYVNPGAYNDPKLADAKFYYYTYGGFLQATKQLWDDKLKITASVRVDKTQYFTPKVNPRIALVYSPAQQHNFRISFQNGYRFPTLFEGFAFVNNGGVRRLGGLQARIGGKGAADQVVEMARVEQCPPVAGNVPADRKAPAARRWGRPDRRI